MPLSRRQLLKQGLMATSGLSLARLADAQIPDPPAPPVIPFARALPIPPVLAPGPGPVGQDSYSITLQEAFASIVPNRQTAVWTYQGAFPGPTIRARSNRQVNLRCINTLAEPVSVHLHGGHAAPQSAGHPDDLINPTALKDYVYPNAQLPATVWYHDHAVGAMGPHVYRGLAGFYILGDAFEDALNLPAGAFDVPVMLQDRLFSPNGSLVYPDTDEAIVRGVLGDRVLLNGAIQPFFAVARRKWRFRLLNASNAREYDLSLSNGQPFIQIGTDGGLLGAPVNRAVIRLAPGERADVVLDFTSLPTGTQVFLRNSRRMPALSGDRSPRDLLRFDVGTAAADTSVVPATLRPVAPLGPEIRTRDFVLGQGVSGGRPAWLINGLVYSSTRIDASPGIGEIEIWRFVNTSTQAHSMHLHLVQFQVVDIGGVPPGPGENGWKDTVSVPPGLTTRVKVRFSGFTGTYAFTAQGLERADHGMMGQFAVVP